MTEKIGRGDRQRGVARITLVVLALVQVVILMATLSDGLFALAQPNPSASATASRNASASPRQSPSQEASPTGPTIQWLNPSRYEPALVVSDKQDNDNAYHLVAWVANRPSDAVVQFSYQGTQGTPNEVTICTATRVPTTNDTYECFWDLDETGTANGTYRLRATLFSSSASPSGSPPPGGGPAAVDEDEETVLVEREAETVEIEYPVNGGPLGVYDPPGAQRAGFVMDVQTSEGAGDVRAYYSESPPGTEPSWQNCQQTTTVFFSDGTRRIGCVLQQGDTAATNITAVAAVPIRAATPDVGPGLNCTPNLPFQTNCPGEPERADSGDAHRVFRYTQDPATVELPPPSENRPNQQGNFSCQVLTSAVRDQNGRPIWRVNMDVHAQGPGDEVRFGSAPGTHPFKAPDQGGHQTENTDTCGNAPAEQATPAQGRHSNVSGADPKHIESVEGSDTSGRFTFAVRSPAREGTSTVTAWADEDDNDERQPSEPFDTTTVTFTRQTAGPSQSTSPSQSTATATATATATQTATASNTSASATSPSGTSPATRRQTLNCEPESDTNPVGSSHTFVCTVNDGSANVSGVRVDVEVSGANDADGDTRATPDMSCTTTGESGSCSITHGPGGFGTTSEPGTSVYRAWIDADGDDRTIEADATEGVNEFGQPGQRNEPDDTDVIEKTWQRAPLDCSPEQDGNPTGTSHTITCRATQGGGAAQQGTHVVAEASGANDPDSGDSPESPDFECRTNQEGVCSFTHGPGGT
ncbi:MAG TPA: hypothetical protein VEV43_04265, partial [Actinomycetota bacterium]|nr:hypothetical protein [Actinomycetota bacterium]